MAANNKNGKPAGFGRSRIQIDIPVEKLHLDDENPRLSNQYKNANENTLLKILYEGYNLLELAESMSQNGYFDEEPLVATPKNVPNDLQSFQPSDVEKKGRFKEFISKEDTEFTVVEGNRRLATVKLLLFEDFRISVRTSKSFPIIDEVVAEDLKKLPVIVYPNRNEVVPYLGVRHILGIEKWDPFAKANYLADLISGGDTVEQVRQKIGDKRDAVLRSYVSYQLLRQSTEEFDYDVKNAKKSFSLLMLAIGQTKIRNFLGLPKKLDEVNLDSPVPQKKIDNLKDLLIWIFGDKNTSPIISDSRQITSLLAYVVDSAAGLRSLKNDGYSLKEAFDLTNGEEEMIIKYLGEANRRLEKVIGIAHRNNTDDVLLAAEKCAANANKLLSDLQK